MTTELITEPIMTAFVVGVITPVVLGFIYWAAVDSAKRYTDSEIREAKQELREYARNQ